MFEDSQRPHAFFNLQSSNGIEQICPDRFVFNWLNPADLFFHFFKKTNDEIFNW
jgi:hypothetical protein